MNLARECAVVFGLAVFAASALAQEEKKADVVETTVSLDAETLAKAKLEGLTLEKGALVLEGKQATGSLDTKDFKASEGFDRLCASLNAETPGTSTVDVLARISLDDGSDAGWLSLGVVATPDEEARLPRSVTGPKTGPVKVDTDTLVLASPRGRSFALRLVLTRGKNGESPRVRRRASVVAWPLGKRDPEPPAIEHAAWGRTLDVPERSQCLEDKAIAGRICSPTSLSMVLAFHGLARPVKEVASEVLDRASGIYGNWALNVAFAGRLGLDAEIVRCGCFAPLEAEIAAGRPAVITHRWKEGELEGAPVKATDGHLIVVRGFTREGDLVVNDPAANPEKGQKIARTYKRKEIAHTWLERADGIAYFLRKPGKS